MRPRMFVIAGPPGSGKSTVFRPNEEQVDYFNADERARDLNDGSGRNISPEIRAQVNKELEQFIANHIYQYESFAYETTLRTRITCDQARLAQANGFLTVMRYVALNSAEESISRVRLRSEKAGTPHLLSAFAKFIRRVCAIYRKLCVVLIASPFTTIRSRLQRRRDFWNLLKAV